MEIKVQKWGNSLAVKIPKIFAKEIIIDKGSAITINREDKKLILEPKQKGEKLKGLLSKITKENIHDEIETGEGVGNEAW